MRRQLRFLQAPGLAGFTLPLPGHPQVLSGLVEGHHTVNGPPTDGAEAGGQGLEAAEAAADVAAAQEYALAGP